MSIRTSIALSLMVVVSGCASYAVPGRSADMRDVGAPDASQLGPGTNGQIRESFGKRPLASFPAGIAVARVQASGYSSATAKGWGEGRFSIVTTRDVEKDEQFQRLTKLPQVRGIAPIGRLLIDGRLDSDLPLRQAAAKLQADMLLIYTFDTTFTTENKLVPLSVITLGLSPNEQVRVTSTASAILLDTRNAYVYGLAEATSQQKRLTSSWQSSEAVDQTRRTAEAEAFDKLVGELERTWAGVLTTHAAIPNPLSRN
jgi:hypothetical protein